jgi:hypothetical protein
MLRLTGLYGVFLDAEQREKRAGPDWLNAAGSVDPDHQDPDDLKSAVTVSCNADLRAAQISDIHERAGCGVWLLGIDGVDSRLRVSRVQATKRSTSDWVSHTRLVPTP